MSEVASADAIEPTAADRAPYPTGGRHLRLAVLAGGAAFAVWAIIEPRVPFAPFHQWPRLHGAPRAQSIVLYAVLGAGVGLVLGLTGGLVQTLTLRSATGSSHGIRVWGRPSAPRYGPYLGAIYAGLATWVILTCAALESLHGPGGPGRTALHLGGALAISLVVFLVGLAILRTTDRPARRLDGEVRGVR